MELLLNLLWLLLAVPAYWLCRRERKRSLLGIVTLGCVLVLLFPVISATDDLHAMRAEMEESSPNKRTLKRAGNDPGTTQIGFSVPPSQVKALFQLLPSTVTGVRVIIDKPLPVMREVSAALCGRAPPSTSIA